MEDEKLLAVLPILRREYNAAVGKHPTFAMSLPEGVSLIAEELGELAREINDELANNRKGLTGLKFKEKALTEAAHVAVTAIRLMQMVLEVER